MGTDGANPINLTNHDALDQTPDWSPDGLRIAFSSNRDRNWEIYVMNPDGANPINLTNHPAWDSQASWEPVPTLSVSPKGGLVTLWGKVKRANTFNGK
jgi:Tol biopolymer transport system component